jgi:glycosyl transferase family 25
MLVRYLNLDRRPDLNRRFLDQNAGAAEFRRVTAADGVQLPPIATLSRDFVDTDLNYSRESLGGAISHHRLWEESVHYGETLTIAIDDAVFNRRFAKASDGVLAKLPADWDIVLWGWNFNSILQVDVIPGLAEAVVGFPHSQLGPRQATYQEAVFDSQALRLLHAFGLVCYSISPRGAGRLLQRCFPLKNERIEIPGLQRSIRNFALDCAMNKHYRSLGAFACFPPLVWTDNEPSQTDAGIR